MALIKWYAEGLGSHLILIPPDPLDRAVFGIMKPDGCSEGISVMIRSFSDDLHVLYCQNRFNAMDLIVVGS
jgi:hypothetical protein